jgi:hypothetical protein
MGILGLKGPARPAARQGRYRQDLLGGSDVPSWRARLTLLGGEALPSFRRAQRKGESVKKLQKRITLDRETVRRLDYQQLGAAQGAINYSTGNICPTYTCSTQPRTCG